jgi:hypothetical protein
VPTSCPGQPSRNGCPVSFLDPWSSTPGGDPMAAAGFPRQGEPINLPGQNVAFPANGGYVVMPTDAKPMRSYEPATILSYQRQVGSRVLVDANTRANQTRNVWIGYAEPCSLHSGQLRRLRHAPRPVLARTPVPTTVRRAPCCSSSTQPKGRCSATTPAATIPA